MSSTNEVISNESHCTKCIIDEFNRKKVSYPKPFKPCSQRRVSFCSECQQIMNTPTVTCCSHEDLHVHCPCTPYEPEYCDHERQIKCCDYHEAVRKNKRKFKHCCHTLGPTDSHKQYEWVKRPVNFTPIIPRECKHTYQSKIKRSQMYRSPSQFPYAADQASTRSSYAPKRFERSKKLHRPFESRIHCGHCNYPVYNNEKVHSLDTPWHKSCLFCFVCGRKLSPGKHAVLNNSPICHFPCMSTYYSSYKYGQGARESRP